MSMLICVETPKTSGTASGTQIRRLFARLYGARISDLTGANSTSPDWQSGGKDREKWGT
jgi:hypothetical protein